MASGNLVLPLFPMICNFHCSTEIWFGNSSMFGIFGLIFTELSFIFLETNAIFTDLSFFTMISTGETKQSSSTCFTFFRFPVFISFSNSLPTSSCRCNGIGLAFYLPDNVQVLTEF